MDTSIDYSDTSEYNPLFLAVHNGEINFLPSLLKKYSATETVQGKTLINIAAARGHAEIVSLLTKSDTDGNSPLHIAIKENQSSVFHLLVKKYNVNEKNCRDETPLRYAVANDRAEFAKILIENGANVNARDNKERTSLYYALKVKKNVQLAEILFKNGAVLTEADYNRWRPLSTAAGDGNLEMVKLLMNNGLNKVDHPFYYESPLNSAVTWGRLKVVKYLMNNGSKSDETITEDTLGLLDSCVKHGKINTLKFLVDTGVKTNANLINGTVAWKRHSVWMYLLTCRSIINSDTFFNETQLHSAVRSNQLEVVKVIISQQANTVKSDSFACKTAVYIAVESRHENILQVLLNAGYSTESCYDDVGPLHLAATYEHTRFVEIFLKAGADVNSETKNGYTPLHFAATAGQPTLVKFLLESGANPLKSCNYHESPLSFALDMFSSTMQIPAFSPTTFANLVKVTKMLITKEKGVSDTLLSAAARINVLSDENKQNNDDEDDVKIKFMLNTDFGQFRPDLVRCILNHHSDDTIQENSEEILEKNYHLDRSPELLHVFMEYNDSKSCSTIDLYSSSFDADFKCHVLLIDFSTNVNDLLNITIIEDESPYFCDAIFISNTEENKVKKIDVLKLIIARLVLLTNSRDSRVSKFCREHKLVDWRKECLQQKVIMQKTLIGDNFDVTFYDILTESVDKVANYVRNENFRKIAESSSDKFPAYIDFLKIHIEKGIRRNDLREECMNLMHNLIKRTHRIRCSNADFDHIFQYFSVVDLRRISEAFS